MIQGLPRRTQANLILLSKKHKLTHDEMARVLGEIDPEAFEARQLDQLNRAIFLAVQARG